MRVSTQFSIAVHVMLMIAGFPDEKITSEVAAESAGCNPVIIRNVFAKLKNANLLITKSGKGKTTLARPDTEITLWDIYCAVESEETEEIFKFHQNTSQTCMVGSNIHSLLAPHFDSAVAALKADFSKVTLADLKEELYDTIRSKASEDEVFG